MNRKQKNLKQKRQRVAGSVRKGIRGESGMPRLSVYRSNRNFACQAINDEDGTTLASVSTLESAFRTEIRGSKVERAKSLGAVMASRLKELGIERVVFDRGWYKYHGCVKAFADAVREGGIKF